MHQDLRPLSLLAHVEVLEDSGRQLGIDDLRAEDVANDFAAPEGSALSFGYSRSAYWLRFSLRNPSPRDVELLLEVGYPQLDEVVLFTPSADGDYASVKSGDALPYRERALPLRNFVFPIAVPGERTQIYYLRVESTSVVSIPLHLSAARPYLGRLQDSMLAMGSFYGVLLGLLAYHFFLFFSTREATYFYYGTASSGYILYFAQLDGLTYRLWPDAGPWQDYSVFAFTWIAGLCLIQFGRHFLDTRNAARGLDRLIQGCLALTLLAPISVPFVEFETVGVLAALFSPAVALLLAAAFLRLRSGFGPAGPYLVAWTPFLLLLPLSSLAALGLLPDFLLVVLGLKLAAVGERILMSLALASRLKTLQEQQLKLARDALSARADALAESEKRRQVESVLGDRDAQLLQAQKMEAVGRLAGGVAHDFNNLLTVIQGYAEMLVERLRRDDDRREMAQEVMRTAEQASALTRQLLAFSRRSSGEAKILDLNQLISSLEHMLSRLLGENVALVLELDPWIGGIKWDPGQIEQIVVNLAVNARDAMPAGGRITLATSEVEIGHEAPVAEDLPEPGRYLRLLVSDTGAGMDPKTLARLFEPFFTTKESNEGTGLGLSTVYGIVKQGGGTIRVESAIGSGARFEILLPRCDDAAEESAAEEGADSEVPRGSETILLAEDEPRVLELTRGRLESLGYAVLAAGDGQIALEIAEKCGDSISLLLTDVVMPGIGGQELSELLRTSYPSLKVMFTSGYPQRPGEPTSRLPSGAAYLQKPASLAQLARCVRDTLDDE